jgi:hypothetical protein
MRRLRPFLVGAAVLALLVGCDTIFTTSPLSWARRDADSKSLEQRVNDAKDALASGKTDEIADAYDAIKDDVAGDGDLELLAGQLTLALSGINDTFDDLSNIDFTDTFAETQSYVNGLVAVLSAPYVQDSASFYADASAHGGDFTGTDYILGAMAMLADATITAGGGDIGNLGAAEVASARTLLTTGQGALPPDDPSYQVISDFAAFLSDPANFP